MNDSAENFPTFFDSGNISFKKAKYIIHKIPYEKTTSFIKGTKDAPDEIIKNSYSLDFLNIETSKEFKDEDFYTMGALKFKKNDSIEISLKKIENYLEKNFIKNRYNIFLGGEHTITYPIVKFLKTKEEKFSLIYFDAHYDLKNSYENTKYSHACVMRRIYELGIDIMGIGIRAGDREEYDFVGKNKLKIMESHNFDFKNLEKQIKSLEKNIYLSVDFDFFSPQLLPSVGTPELDGFSLEKYKKILNIIKNKNIIGMDFVEFSPIKNIPQYSYLAASIIFKTLAILT